MNPVDQQQKTIDNNAIQENPLQQSNDQQNKIKEGDTIIIYENMNSLKMIQVKSGNTLQNKFGVFPHDCFIGQQYGSKIYSKNKNTQGYVYILRPNPALITESISHFTQILYQTDISVILVKLNIMPKSIVVESGTGSGSLSCSISNNIQEDGHLFTFEFNEERAKNAVNLFQKLGLKNIDVIWRDVLNDGFSPKITDQYKLAKCDSVFLDLPQPYLAINHAKVILKNGGKICCFSPCIEQVQQNCQELDNQGFIEIETIEVLSRNIERNDKQFVKVFEINDINIKRKNEEMSQEQKQTSFKGLNKKLTYSTGQQENKGHTGYLTFALLP